MEICGQENEDGIQKSLRQSTVCWGSRLWQSCTARVLKATVTSLLCTSPPPNRDLYIIFTLKVLESYNYFSLSRLLVLYLTENFGVDDYNAGVLYGLWGTLLTAYGFFLGGAIDILGECAWRMRDVMPRASALAIGCQGSEEGRPAVASKPINCGWSLLLVPSQGCARRWSCASS